MAKSKLQKAKGRRESGAFAPIPCSALNHRNMYMLSSKANKLLLLMLSKIRFKTGGPVNNGDISIPWSDARSKGWRSKQTLQKARDELLYYGFITLTRQGGLNQCSLYAITWWSIDECKGKLDVKATTIAANTWKANRDKFSDIKKKPYPDNHTYGQEIDPISVPERLKQEHKK